MDEQGVNESEFSAFETDEEEHDDTRLDTIIEDKTLEALRYVYQNADESLVPWEKFNALVIEGPYPFSEFEEEEVQLEQTLEGAPDYVRFSTFYHKFLGCKSVGGHLEYYPSWTVGVDADPDKYIYPDPRYLYYSTSDDKYYTWENGELIEYTGDTDGAGIVAGTGNTDEAGIAIEVDNDFVDGYTAVRVSFDVSVVWRWRLVGLSSWTRMVSLSESIDISEPAYAMLHDPLCTGTWERPRVGLDYSSNGETRLTLLSQKDTSDTVVMDYVRMPVWETTATESQQTEQYVNVGEKLEDAFLYYLAGLTCMVLGDERQGGFFQQAAELMGKETKS